jgi:hypothetical protein
MIRDEAYKLLQTTRYLEDYLSHVDVKYLDRDKVMQKVHALNEAYVAFAAALDNDAGQG